LFVFIEIIPDIGHGQMTIEHVEKLTSLDEYDDISSSLALLTCLDLDRLLANDERLCFFINLYNFLIIIAHTELIRTTSTSIMATNLFHNDLERLLFMLTTRVDVGQLKQISLFDIRHYILQQTISIDGLQFDHDPNSPFCRYAPTIHSNQTISIGLILNDCIASSAPFIVLTPDLLTEQLQRSTREFIDRCVIINSNKTVNKMNIFIPNILQTQFDRANENIIPFIGEYSSNNDVLCAINGKTMCRSIVRDE
jgi:hypothetical protein